jgi:hypothetical protein
MATRTKTVEYGIPNLAAMDDNTDTDMTTITVYLPEQPGGITFRKCWVKIGALEGATMTTGDYSSRRIDVSVNAAGAHSYTNANSLAGSGEQVEIIYTADCTDAFVDHWPAATSATVDISVLVDSTAATIVFVNVSAVVCITYEYDDTQATQVKTVRIPLNAPVTALATAKPAEIASIPALDVELPEASKTYRNMFVTFQGNVKNTGSTVDSTLSQEIAALGAFTTAELEMGATSDYWMWLVWVIQYYTGTPEDAGIGMDTSIANSYYMWASVARHNHPQAWLTVTYAFDASDADNGVFVSVMMPCRNAGPMGGVTDADYQSIDVELWVEEPVDITTKQVAFYAFWEQAGAIAGLNMQIGTGAWVAYTDAAQVMCGSNGAMVRNDAEYTLVRGKNTLRFSAYRTDATDLGFNLSGFWIINYTAARPTNGYGAANHTVRWPLKTLEGASSGMLDIAATAPIIADPSYFMSGCGVLHESIVSASTVAGTNIEVERTAAEGGVVWLGAVADIGPTTGEVGLRSILCSTAPLFLRWPTDPGFATDGLARLDIETSRRWRARNFNPANVLFRHIELWATYHSNTFAVAGDVTIGAGAATVELWLEREITTDVWEQVLYTSRVGDGAFSFTWYDSAQHTRVVAHDGTHFGVSDVGHAA